MELKVVYRILRKISDWSVSGFYSEVHVEGQENVRRDGPLIIASTHHNEIIDIATLAATIPHGRHVSFWAKSSMFSNPLARAILLSSGAIPVKRNPNHGDPGTSTGNGLGNRSQSRLFNESSNALAAGQVIGVFPEGTSYTQPSIVQVMSGAAWAGVDYVRSVRERRERSAEGKAEERERELTIVPVAIVYTDKARYLSRVCVKYGKPIVVASYMEDILGDDIGSDAATRAAIKEIMAEIEKQMRAMSINAPDWDTLYAAQMARDILWKDPANIPLKDWVSISQTLIAILTAPANTTTTDNTHHLEAAKASLTKYYALLHYTNIEHSILTSIISRPSYITSLLPLLSRVPLAFCSILLFVPPMLLHIPAYLTGSLAGRFLAAKGEDEAKAQFKAIFGGVGLGISAGVVLRVLRKISWFTRPSDAVGEVGGVLGGVKRTLQLLGLTYSSVYLLIKLHNAMVYDKYRLLKTAMTLHKCCLGHIPQRAARARALERYTRPPPPPRNPFIKRKEDVSRTDASETRRQSLEPVPSRKLIRPLFAARAEAFSTLDVYLRSRGDDEAARFLRGKNAQM
ncbi:glycerol-3-phosphate-1-acyltransferase [Lyophyllum atratum]|nr:glycerol-3-phosphate-1-acyltransferase [Lyophyllum atratum]